jgi:oxygen-independent coproporphyrinogen-3 oxidase
MTTGVPGFGVYVHWPFCAAKCPYCDFNSHVRHAPPDQQRYVAAFCREIATAAERTGGRTVASVFFGGGTPSLMRPQTVGAILEAIAARWRLADDVEVTLEANPSSVEADRFRGYRVAGVNRVSLGVQSLNDGALRFLGRLHDVAQARAAIDIARATFPRLSFDLIYARPGQTVDAWVAELSSALTLACDHISLYQLTIEDGTPFASLHRAGKLVVPGEALAADLFRTTQSVCAAAGFPAYEISNHARPGGECRHNLVYWRYGEYVGVGPGAHGRLVLPDGRYAVATEASPEAWLRRVERRGEGTVVDDLLSPAQAGDEMLLMGLRLAEGIDIERFRRIAGRSLDGGKLSDLIAHGMVERTDGGGLRATRDGACVLDSVVADLSLPS